MKTVIEAREHILRCIPTMPVVERGIDEALGFVLAESITAPVSAPPFDNSAMDGYAVRWADCSGEKLPVSLPIAFDVPAGVDPAGEMPPGSAVRIMTGGRVPIGADTVIMREDTEESTDRVSIRSLPRAGANVRKCGTYFEKGGALLDRGTLLDPGAVGLLASVGICRARVHRRPRVAVVSTGDELVTLGQTPGPSQIVNSSAHMLRGLITEAGGTPVILPIARDTVENCRAHFDDALASADMVISIGGVSVGDFDVVREVMQSLGSEMGFWKVKMKPGKPLAFGLVGGTPLLGLPGNPVSSFVSFFQFVFPAIRRLRGLQGDGALERVQARLATSLRSPAARADYQRGTLTGGDGAWSFHPVSHQGSGNLTSVANCQGFAIIPEGVAGLEEGATVSVERLPPSPRG